MNEQELQKEQVQQQQQQPEGGNKIETLIAQLKKQGLDVEQIAQELQKLASEGQLSEEELAQAMQILEAEEKQEASKMFGINLL